MSVRIHATAPYNFAGCKDCDFVWRGNNVAGGYKSIKRHVEKTGHTVVRKNGQTTTYSKE